MPKLKIKKPSEEKMRELEKAKLEFEEIMEQIRPLRKRDNNKIRNNTQNEWMVNNLSC